MTLEQWRVLLASPVDLVGLILFVLFFPIYHGIYPWLMLLFPNRAAKVRLDEYRRSWIEVLIDSGQRIVAVQQTRNLTMVNSLLASSALILMGFTANLLTRIPEVAQDLHQVTPGWHSSPTVTLKLMLLVIVFSVAFAYCMTALRHLGHFNLVIGADPKVLDRREGSAVDYLSALINRASNRSTLAVRCLYSASPLFLWLFDSRLFLGLTVLWGVKFIAFQDFAHVLKGHERRRLLEREEAS